jgi:scyllo-inositol 2-dehydrogenase (NADP+)
MKAGFDVLCEKPFARTVAEVDRMAAVAKKTGRFLAVFQQSRFSPAFRKIRQVIESGVLGRVALVKISYNGFSRRWDWQTLQENNGGSLLNTGPHPVDQALQLFGTDRVPRVSAVLDRATTFGDAEDVVKLVLSGPGRPTIDVEICSCAAYSPWTYVVNGSQGSLCGTLEHLDWKYYDPATAPKQAVTLEPLPGRTWCSEDLTWKQESWDIPKDGPSVFDTMGRDFYLSLYESWVDRTRPLVVQLAHVRQQIAVMEDAHRQNPLPRGTNAGR